MAMDTRPVLGYVLYRMPGSSRSTATKLIRLGGRIPVFKTEAGARTWRDERHKAAGLRGICHQFVRPVYRLTKDHLLMEGESQ